MSGFCCEHGLGTVGELVCEGTPGVFVVYYSAFSQAGAISNLISSSLVYFVDVKHLHILVTCMNEIRF